MTGKQVGRKDEGKETKTLTATMYNETRQPSVVPVYFATFPLCFKRFPTIAQNQRSSVHRPKKQRGNKSCRGMIGLSFSD
jgi:hypothetical protein